MPPVGITLNIGNGALCVHIEDINGRTFQIEFIVPAVTEAEEMLVFIGLKRYSCAPQTAAFVIKMAIIAFESGNTILIK